MERIKNKIIAECALELVKKFDLAIDVGAHDGEWINILKNKFEHIHSFEPAENLYKNLITKFINNKNVNIYNTALMNKNCEGSISNGKSWAGFVTPGNDESISIRKLDKYKFENCGLLKIDVEGAELLVLKGGEKLINKTAPVIIVECKSRTALRYGWTPEQMNKWLMDRKYILKFRAYPNLVYGRDVN